MGDRRHERWQALLPFYVAGALEGEGVAGVERHLSTCAECRAALRSWQALGEAVVGEAEARSIALPPLSEVLRGNLRRRPTVRQALNAALSLVWAQRVALLREGAVPVVLLVLVLGLAVTIGLQSGIPVALPLLAAVPALAAIGVLLVYNPDLDPAFELVAAAPTFVGTLLFARLTLLLGGMALLSLLASGLLGLLAGASLGPLVAAWLGPMLLLAALSTVLALLWRPIAAAVVSLALWAGVVALVAREFSGRPLLRPSLLPLLHPGWPLLLGQVAAAGLLWLAGWALLSRGAGPGIYGHLPWGDAASGGPGIEGR